MLYCAAGGQAALAGATLLDMGYENVHNLGSFQGWKDAGGEVENRNSGSYFGKSVLITGGRKRLGRKWPCLLRQKAGCLHYKNSWKAESTREKLKSRIGLQTLFCRPGKSQRIRGNDEAGSLGIPDLDLLVHNASVFDESPCIRR